MKFFSNFSANAIQLIVNQLAGLAIFYVLSNNLDKGSFGQINLALAILLTAFSILPLGIDTIAVRKVASGYNPEKLLSTYMGHVLIFGGLFYSFLLVGTFLSGGIYTASTLLLYIGIGKLLMFFSTPFKQLASGKEQFTSLAYMSVISNVIRAAALLTMAFLHSANLMLVVAVFVAGDFAELIFTIYFFRVKVNVPIVFTWDGVAYKQVLKEAMLQLGSVLFTATMARFDWIFIGLFLSAIKLAEYSFAYKVFELCTLPLLAIAPLLLPWFTRAFNGNNPDAESLKNLLRYELIIAFLVSVLLYVCWNPIIDPLTNGKYGLVNLGTVFWLAMCMPLLYFSNFLWTICFACKQMKFVLFVIGTTCLLNVMGNVLLIPILKNEGAGLSYFIALFSQCILYSTSTEVKTFRKTWISLALMYASAFLAGYISISAFAHPIQIAASTVFLFFILMILTKQLRKSDLNFAGKSLQLLS